MIDPAGHDARAPDLDAVPDMVPVVTFHDFRASRISREVGPASLRPPGDVALQCRRFRQLISSVCMTCTTIPLAIYVLLRLSETIGAASSSGHGLSQAAMRISGAHMHFTLYQEKRILAAEYSQSPSTLRSENRSATIPTTVVLAIENNHSSTSKTIQRNLTTIVLQSSNSTSPPQIQKINSSTAELKNQTNILSSTNTNQSNDANFTEFCSSAEDPYMAALITFTYNVLISLALAPVGFIGIFISDARKRGCKCSEKVSPEPEKPSTPMDSIPPQIMIVSEKENQSEQPADLTEVLGNIKVFGCNLGISEWWQSAGLLFYNVGYRGVFVFIQIMKKNYINPTLFAIDISMTAYFGYKKMYCPGCMYNDIHVLLYKRKFVHVRFPSSFTCFTNGD
jgi:hypothetical protein